MLVRPGVVLVVLRGQSQQGVGKGMPDYGATELGPVGHPTQSVTETITWAHCICGQQNLTWVWIRWDSGLIISIYHAKYLPHILVRSGEAWQMCNILLLSFCVSLRQTELHYSTLMASHSHKGVLTMMAHDTENHRHIAIGLNSIYDNRESRCNDLFKHNAQTSVLPKDCLSEKLYRTSNCFLTN